MNNKSCLKEFIQYAALNVLGMLGLSCYILADTFFVAKGLGVNGLAALNLAIPVYSFIHGTGLMIGMGGGIRYSILRGQDNAAMTGEECNLNNGAGQEKMNQVFSKGLLLAGILAALFLVSGLFASDYLAALLGAEGAVFEMTGTYLKVLLLFAPAFLLNELLLCFVRNDGAPQLTMLAMLGGSFSNILLDYVFIFPLNMGIFGAVFATGLAPIISLMILSPFFIRKKNHFHVVWRSVSFHEVRNIIGSGFSSLVTEVSSGIVMIIFNMIILGLEGTTGVAAYGVIANISLVVMAVYTGIAQGMQPLLSDYYGRGEKERMGTVLGYGVMTVVGLSVLIYSFLFLKAAGVTSVFNSEKDAAMQLLSEEGIKIYFTACVFVGFNIILAAYFTCKDLPGRAAVLSLLRGFLLIIPMAFLLSFLFRMKGVWASFPAAELLVALLGIWMLRRKEGKKF